MTEICDHLEDRLLERETDERDEAQQPASIEDHVNRSLWIAALTTYGRCFLKGVRYSLPESLFLRTPGMDYTHLHRYFTHIRNKHVAHSVNELEAHEALVTLEQASDGSMRVASLNIFNITLAYVQHSDVQRLGSMANYASVYAQERYEDLSQRAFEKAKGLSQQELSKLRPFEFRGREDFVSRESARAMEKPRRGRNRKKPRT